MENKYIEIIFREKPAKTKIYEVVSKGNSGGLGVIKWYGAWRQYCFFPYTGTIFNKDCLKFIERFLVEENEIYKLGRKS